MIVPTSRKTDETWGTLSLREGRGRRDTSAPTQAREGYFRPYTSRLERLTIADVYIYFMSPIPDDLSTIKDDMIAFIEGHGMRRFHGYVDYEEVQCVMWEMDGNPDGWKDFVELAKSAGAPFLTMHSWTLEREELDELVQRLSSSEFSDGDDVEDARWLRAHANKVGFLQLGWAFQGSMFLCEVSTEWYERYQRLLEVSDEFGGLTMDEPDQDEES